MNTIGFILFYVIFVQPSTSFLAVLVKQGKKKQQHAVAVALPPLPMSFTH